MIWSIIPEHFTARADILIPIMVICNLTQKAVPILQMSRLFDSSTTEAGDSSMTGLLYLLYMEQWLTCSVRGPLAGDRWMVPT